MGCHMLHCCAFLTSAALAAGEGAGHEDAGRGPGGRRVWFQAHRGGRREVPENTLAGFRYAWDRGGIPELDLRTTRDGVLICLHDATLARTTDADSDACDVPVSRLTLDEIRRWDAGVRFAEAFAGQRVPAVHEVFAEMAARPEWQAYLDLKEADLVQLAGLLEAFSVAEQVIFCHDRLQSCRRLRELCPGARVMVWIGGTPDEIKARFGDMARSGFEELNQVQLHLPVLDVEGRIEYAIDEAYLREALETTRTAGVDLQVFPFEFDADSLGRLLDLGIRWYVTDEPARFVEAIRGWEPLVNGDT